MAKSVINSMLDSALDTYLSAHCDLMVACSAEPSNYTQATTTYALADVAMAGGDFTAADGDVSGRKVTVAQKTGITVDSAGNATHVALCNTTNTTLLYVTTCSNTAIAGTLTINAWDIEIADPS